MAHEIGSDVGNEEVQPSIEWFVGRAAQRDPAQVESGEKEKAGHQTARRFPRFCLGLIKPRPVHYVLASDSAVGQPLASNPVNRNLKPVGVFQRLVVRILPVVIAKHLLVQIAEKVERLYRNVGALQSALQQTPKVLKPVGVDFPFRIGFGVVNHAMNVLSVQSEIGGVSIGEKLCSSLEVFLDRTTNLRLVSDRKNLGPNLTVPSQQAHDGGLAERPIASDSLLALVRVHVPRLAADVGFIRFDLTGQLGEKAGVHRKVNAVQDEPCRLLGDAQRPVNLVGTNPVFAIGNHPDSDEPLAQRQGAILEDGSDLDAELPLGVLGLALPDAASSQEAHLLAATSRANCALRPSAGRKKLDAGVRIGKVCERLLQGLWSVVGIHK